MRGRRARILRFVGLVAGGVGPLVACTLAIDTSGLTGGSGAPPAPIDEAGADRATVSDAPSQPDVAVDAPAGCTTNTAIDAPFSSSLDRFTSEEFGVSGYPKVAPFFGSPAAVLFPFVDPSPKDAGPDAAPTYLPQYEGGHSSMWLSSSVPLASFDASFEVQIRCTSSGSCADGLVVAWIATTDLAIFDNESYGHAAGLPKGVDGAGIVFDNYQNNADQTADPPAPSMQIVAIDGARPLGLYPWQIVSKPTTFLGPIWHRVTLRMRAGNVAVTYDDQAWLSASTKPIPRGTFGFTAGTGGETDVVAVRNFKATFLDCP